MTTRTRTPELTSLSANDVRSHVEHLIDTHRHGPQIEQILGAIADPHGHRGATWTADDIEAWAALSTWQRSLLIHHLDLDYGIPRNALNTLDAAT